MSLKIVLTGGPGVGKTSIVDELHQRGFDVRPEVFTEIFSEAVQRDDFEQLFLEPDLLLHELTARQKAREDEPSQSELLFLDRSMIDILGFAHMENLTMPPQDLTTALQAHYDIACVIEPMARRYYVQNEIRKQDCNEALRHHAAVVANYKKCFEGNGTHPLQKLISIPAFHSNRAPMSIVERTDYLLEQIGQRR